MEQKKKEQDVLVVRDEQTGEIGVVAGLKRDGTPNMKAAKAEHAQDFLRFDRHGDVLDNFFANFFRQCMHPKRFSFYRVATEGLENVLTVIKEMLGAALDDKQQAALARGEGVYVEGMTSKNNGKVFNATIQINADRRGLDFHFGERKQQQRQEQTQAAEDGKQEKPRKLRIGSTLLQRPITDEIKKGWEQNKWVYMEGLIDRKGKPFNAYVRPNHERGKYDFSRKRPEEAQIHEIKPDNTSRTQVAVNSEGKTHEATKHVGEPLQRGQTAPANEEQQRRQQNANRPRMKM